MNKHQQIVVGIDFSTASRAALQVATRFGSTNHTKVTALHIIDPAEADDLQHHHGFSDAELLDYLHERLRSFVVGAESGVCRLALETDVGRPFPTLMAACERLAADLLVLGTRGTKHGPNQIGDIAAACIREAPVDVLLAREGRIGPFHRILACVDFSASSQHAVQEARQLAEGDHAELDCLFVHQSFVGGTPRRESRPPMPKSDANPESGSTAKRRLDSFVEPLLPSDHRVPWHAVVSERSSVHGAIFEHVAAHDVDLVVLGSRPDQGHRAYTAGTTAEEIIGHARCSVLTVRPPH